MATTQFDLEQAILDTWHVTDDLKVVYESLMEGRLKCDVDNVVNILMGMEKLYQLKFEKSFGLFEKLLAEQRPQSPLSAPAEQS